MLWLFCCQTKTTGCAGSSKKVIPMSEIKKRKLILKEKCNKIESKPPSDEGADFVENKIGGRER